MPTPAHSAGIPFDSSHRAICASASRISSSSNRIVMPPSGGFAKRAGWALAKARYSAKVLTLGLFLSSVICYLILVVQDSIFSLGCRHRRGLEVLEARNVLHLPF